MSSTANHYSINHLDDPERYNAPSTKYCKSKAEFDACVGLDFIEHVNQSTETEDIFLVGLSHGQSPAGAYEYIINHYDKINHPEKLKYTCINSKLTRQRGLIDVMDAQSFLKTLLEQNRISKDQILGRKLNRDSIEEYCKGLNDEMMDYLSGYGKTGLDYVFVASDPNGLVAGITRFSKAFNSNEVAVLVNDTKDVELTYTPHFLKKTKRIAFLATKSDKRKPLAWLFYKWANKTESPTFLRFIYNVDQRMKVFIEAKALTWPQVVLTRKTGYGETTIRVDMADEYDEYSPEKKPVVLMIHGFLGLNSFDALLAFMPEKYIAGAMHYGSIPYDLPPEDFSQFVLQNIDTVINHFGSKGHPVYVFDHSMANAYMLMADKQMNKLPGFSKYLKGRIAANPFFGREVKHASINFIDSVILPSNISLYDRASFKSVRTALPFYTKNAVRNNSMRLSSFLIRSDNGVTHRIWRAIKDRILMILTDIDTLPKLNRVPIEHTLNKLPVKIFAIQVQSALRESKKLDTLRSLKGYEKHNISILVLKSEKDPIAKFVPHFYKATNDCDIIDITNFEERDLFKEHLYYLIRPRTTLDIIEQFIEQNESK